MASITTRAGKGSPLTNAEVDANFTNINTELGQKEVASNKGAAGGYASLDAGGKVPASQLPSYVDDVVEAANFLSLPGTGETGKIYVVLDTNKSYRWSGSAYIEIASSPGSTDAIPEGSTNLYFTNARARSAISATGSLSYNSSTGVMSFTDAVTSVAGKTGAVTLTNSDVGLGNVENKSSATIRGELTSSNVTTALGFTPYNATNPSGYITSSALSSYLPLSGGTLTGKIGWGTSMPNQKRIIGIYESGNLFTGIGMDASNAGVRIAGDGSAGTLLDVGQYSTDGNYSWTSRLLVSTSYASFNGNTILHAGNYNSYSPTLTGTGASGTWGINITGNAATATSATDSTKLPLSGGTVTGFFGASGGSKITVQGFADGGSDRGIFLWSHTDSNWGIYMAQSGAGRSLSGATAPASIDGRTAHAVRFRAYGSDAIRAFIWENDLDQCVASLTPDTGNFYTRGQMYAGNSTSNVVLHAGNYSSYALPLSGGTLTGSPTISGNGNGLYFTGGNNRIYFGGSYRAMEGNGNGTQLQIGEGYSATYLQSANNYATTSNHLILHAGNYSSYALPLSGGTLTGDLTLNGNNTYFGGNVYLRANSDFSFLTNSGSAQNGRFRGIQVSSSYSGAVPENGILFGTDTTLVRGASTYGSLLVGGARNGYWGTMYDTGQGNAGWMTNGNASGYYAHGHGWKYYHESGVFYIHGGTYGGGAVYTALHSGNYTSYALPLSGGTLSGAIRATSITAGGGTNTDAQFGVAGTAHLDGTVYFGGSVGNVGSWSSRQTSSSGTQTLSLSRFIVDRQGYGSQSLIDAQNGLIALGQPTRIEGGIRQGNNLARPLAEWSASGTSTGMVYIELPGTTSNYGMVHAVIDVYEYNGNAAATIIVGGHNWVSSWYNVSCNVIGQTNKPVRLAVRGGKFVICIGDASSVWDYGTVMLRKIHNASFYNNIMDMGAQFVIAQTTSEGLSGATGDLRALRTPAGFNAGGAITQAGNQVLHAGNYTSYAPSLTGSGASGTWGINITGNCSGTLTGTLSASASANTIGRHLDATNAWGSPTTLFLGWYTGKVIIGNNNHSVHDPAFNGGSDVVYIGNPTFARNYQSFGNQDGTGNASRHPSGIYSTGTNWLYGTIYLNGNTIDGCGRMNGPWTSGSRCYSNEWIEFGNYSGLYSPLNGAHFYPNNASYGSWRVAGSRNGWHGLHFDSGSTLMVNSSEVGFHREGHGWQMWWSGGTGYVHKGNPGGGTQATILDSSNYTSYSPSLGGSGASGTWGINITGQAGSISGQANSATITASTGVNGSQIVQRDGNGYIYANHINFNTGVENPSIANFITDNGDGWSRKSSLAHVKNSIRGVADGTWSINVTGSAGTLQGYAWDSAGKNVRGSQIYVDNWFRNYSSNTGLYNETTTQHWSSNANGYWDASSTTTVSAIRFYTGGHVSALRGYVYANTSNEIGFLNSAGNWSWRMDNSGNGTATGNVTAYSDERLKKDWSPIYEGFVERLAVMRCGTYTRIDSGQRQAGVSAQNMREILPEVVSEDNDGTLALAYGNAALVSAVELAKEIVALKRELEALKSKLH